MPIEKLRPSFTFTEDKMNELKKIVPEAFADGKINWETLNEALGEYLEDDEEVQEHFGLFWPGKRQARRIAAIPSKGTLAPVYGEGLKADGTSDSDGQNDSRNIFIEGENLEVLKILQKSYAGRIKMIYIDPPYNTGNDFVYDDNFTEPLQEYLRRTGQVDEEGQPLTTNKKADGRFHSKWLSMMYPRLRLAKNLLRDDGVIFVSIDDNEVHNLRAIMNELFGEENFIANIIWEKKYTRSNDARWFSDNHDHILVYGISKEIVKFNLQPRNKEQLEAYSNPDNHPKGLWKSTPLHAKSGNKTGFSYTFKNGVSWSPPPGTYPRFSKETLKKLDENNEIWFGENEKSTPSRKTFLSEAKEGVTPITIWKYNEVGHNHEANEELKKLRLSGIFNNPKPTRLLKRMIELSTYKFKNDIILDFFSGSATSAHAVTESNIENNENRKYILIQMPELCDEKSEAYQAGYKTIAEIGKERIRRVSEKIKEEKKKNRENSDLGFKCFSLNFSNYKEWLNCEDTDIKKLELKFDQFETPLRENWTEKGLLTETMLIEGFSLDSRIENLENFKRNKLKKVTSEFCDHALLVCFDDKINDETIAQLNLNDKDIFICLDSAITDQDKLRLSDRGLIKTI